VQTIVTTRHYAYHPKEGNLIFRLERGSACLNKMTVAISPAVENHLIRVEGYDRRKVTVILNAVDPRLFAPIADERSRSVKGDHRIVSVGHLHAQKGHDVLIEGMTEITREIPEAKLLIIGDGPQKAALKQLVQELQLSNSVDLLGSMPPDEVIETLKGAHVFALASNWEGFGIAVIEAMASGKPVVATDVEGLRDVVKDGSTGFLVPRGEPGPLAEKIILLLRNPDLRLQMGREGRKRVEVLFSLDNMMVGLETMYRDLLG
jgi:glycosyltransferase involved in cell wall biosynthesis